MSVDHYQTLGVSRDASADEIKKAFRGRARELHPDTSDHPEAEEAFKGLNEAYEVLSDPEKRAMYDRFGTADPRRAGGYDGGDDFSAAYGDLFSVFFGGVSGAANTLRREGRHMIVQVDVTLREAADGVAKEVSYTRDAPCDSCEGTGAAEGGESKTCGACSGTGQERTTRNSFLGTFQSVGPCRACGSLGTVVEPPCAECGSSGRAPREETVSVDVPPGVEDGQQVVLPDMGEAGFRGSSPGDLVATIRVQPHEFLHRQGPDLHARADVAMTKAALGGDIVVEGLRGPVTVHVAAGSQNGDMLRVKGEGMPSNRGTGDLIVHVNVVVPKKVTRKQREILEQLAAEGADEHDSSVLHRLRDWLGM